MRLLVALLVWLLCAVFMRGELALENLALRQPLTAYARKAS